MESSDGITNDGGRAFPFAADYGPPAACGGMTLRDYFAGQALAGICGDGIPGSHHVASQTARDAYEYADAMLLERQK